jgi:hypothetical protein
MRTKLTKAEVKTLASIQARLSKLADRLEEDDVDLHYGNGTAASQVDCAIAAIESILQEY